MCINLKWCSSTAPADPEATGTPGAHQHHSAYSVWHGYWTDPAGWYPPPAQLLWSRGPDGQLHPQEVQWASSTTTRFTHLFCLMWTVKLIWISVNNISQICNILCFYIYISILMLALFSFFVQESAQYLQRCMSSWLISRWTLLDGHNLLSLRKLLQ